MNTQWIFLVFFIYFISLSRKTHAFCVSPSNPRSNRALTADLIRATVRSTDWLRKTYKDNTTELRPYRAGSIFATLRIAGHNSKTLLSDFKDANDSSIEETLKNKLASMPNGNLSTIPTPHLGLIIQGVISICKDPRNFHGHNLIRPLLEGFPCFKKCPSFSNYFGYSLAVIALCNAGEPTPEYDPIIKELIKGANRKVSYHSVDIDALILTALSCASSSNSTLQSEKDKAMSYLVKGLFSKQNNETGAFGNQYSTALAVEALQAARVHTDEYLCEKAMRHILSYQDEEGSFGTILANIQVTPALLGESLISLRKYPCPAEPPTTPPPEIIAVVVKLVFNVTNVNKTDPKPVTVENIPQGTTAYEILEQAKSKDYCYTATYKKYSFGRSVTSICGVETDWRKKQYWMIYINGKTAQYGVDGLKPKDGDKITFIYKKLNF